MMNYKDWDLNNTFGQIWHQLQYSFVLYLSPSRISYNGRFRGHRNH